MNEKTRTYDKHWMPWLKRELGKNGIKMTPEKVQEEIGEIALSKTILQPIGVCHWDGSNISNTIDVLVKLFNLPHPLELIEIINSSKNYSNYIEEWFNDIQEKS